LLSNSTTFFTDTLYDGAINLSIIIMGLYISVITITNNRKTRKRKLLNEDENYDNEQY
jgi:hypothetical protein